MSSSDLSDSPKISSEQASRLLRQRLMFLGATAGAVMGLAWVLVMSLLVDAFPGFGDPVFLIFLFLAVGILGAAGAWVGIRAWKNILKDAGK